MWGRVEDASEDSNPESNKDEDKIEVDQAHLVAKAPLKYRILTLRCLTPTKES